MGIFRQYLTMALFAAGLLFGVQAPNFWDQYEKRIDAHLIEARAHLAGFIDIAEKMYDGDVGQLIAKHAGSTDEAFSAEEQVLAENFERLERYETAKEALEANVASKVSHILFFPEREALGETVKNYTAAFPLTAAAIISGICVALSLCLFFELCFLIVRCFFRGIVGLREKRHSLRIKRPGDMEAF